MRMWMGKGCLFLAGSFLLLLVACDGARDATTAPERSGVEILGQGQGHKVGLCRHECLREMRSLQREEARRYRTVVRSCQGDPACLRIAREVYEMDMAELEDDAQACMGACK